MRPLLIHASSKSQSDVLRRVLHIEYSASMTVGKGLEIAVACDSIKVDVRRRLLRRERRSQKGSPHPIAIGAAVGAAGTAPRPSRLPGFSSRSRH